MAVNEIDPAPAAPPAGKKTRVRIDWSRGAALLVAGEAPDAVAAALGITQDRLWRHLRNSARFQFLLRQARETQLLLGRLQLEAASNAAAIRCAHKAEKPPAALFEQFKISSQPAWDKPSSVDGRDMVLRLADSQRRAPKRARRAAETGGLSQNKTQISPDKTQISENKSPVSTAKATDKPLAGEHKALKPQPAEPTPQPAAAKPQPAATNPPSSAGRKYDHVALGLQNGGIIDLTDMYGNPLPGVRHEWDTGARRPPGGDDMRRRRAGRDPGLDPESHFSMEQTCFTTASSYPAAWCCRRPDFAGRSARPCRRGPRSA